MNLFETITQKNIIQGDKFKFIADDFLDEEKQFLSLVDKPKLIFCKTDYLPAFENKILPKINYKFTLISHNSDIPVDGRHLNILNNNNLIEWFGMNCHIKHRKLTPIPIGIANEKWPHGKKDILEEVANEKISKKNRVYCNFNPNTNIVRYNILEKLKKYDFIDFENNNLDYKSYLRKLASYKYVISPPGNSVDCHRIWESIYLKTLPVVHKDNALDTFNKLPIIFIEDWENLNLNSFDKFSFSDKNLYFSNFSYLEKLITDSK